MSETKKDGGPAFPCDGYALHATHDANGEVIWRPKVHGGMSLRDYFAAAALTGMLAKYTADDLTAERAYHMADKMLAARAPRAPKEG